MFRHITPVWGSGAGVSAQASGEHHFGGQETEAVWLRGGTANVAGALG